MYYKLLTARGWNAYKRNELNAEKITNMSLRLNYEAVVQYLDIEDNDLLYFSYANQVSMTHAQGRHGADLSAPALTSELGAKPLMLAADRAAVNLLRCA